MLRRYVHGPGSDEPIVWYEGAGTGSRRFLQADERGSVIAVSDSSGASLGINRYDEYGIPQTGNLGRFSYTGQTALAEVGLMYYKARMYSPGLGRFMQTDPIGYGDGLGWYNYVGGDPVNFVDPSGLEKVTCTGSRIQRESCDGIPGLIIIGGHYSYEHVNRLIAAGGSGDEITVIGPIWVPDDFFALFALTGVAGVKPQSGKDDLAPCNIAQRGLQKLGKYSVGLGADVTTSGAVIAVAGVAVAAVSASTLVLAPGGVLAGGSIVAGGASVVAGGGVISTGGALLMLAGGSGKAAVSDLASRVVTSRIPKGLGGELIGDIVGRAVDAIPFEFKTCS